MSKESQAKVDEKYCHIFLTQTMSAVEAGRPTDRPIRHGQKSEGSRVLRYWFRVQHTDYSKEERGQH